MENNNKKHRPVLKKILIIALAVIVILVVAVFLNIPKHQQVSDTNYNLTELADGVYEGECTNGLVYVKVEVTIHNNTIADVNILEHRNGMGKGAEKIADVVTNNQSIEIDAVSGATFSSQTILKAVENALVSSN